MEFVSFHVAKEETRPTLRGFRNAQFQSVTYSAFVRLALLKLSQSQEQREEKLVIVSFYEAGKERDEVDTWIEEARNFRM